MSENVIGVFPMFNTGGICVHTIDEAEEKVLASINGEDPEWCKMSERPQLENGGDNEELESGFLFGSFFVPFSQVMRVYEYKIAGYGGCSPGETPSRMKNQPGILDAFVPRTFAMPLKSQCILDHIVQLARVKLARGTAVGKVGGKAAGS